MSLAKTAVRGGLWSAGINYVGFGLNLVGNIILARLLMPEDFGVFALALSIIDILFILGGFGFAQACIQLQDEKDIFSTGLLLTWGVALMLALLGVGAAWIGSYFYTSQVILFVLVLCPLKALQFPSSIYLAFLEKNFSFRRSALIRTVGRSVAVLVSILTAMYGLGVWSLLVRESLSLIFIFSCALIFSSLQFKLCYNQKTAGKIFSFSVNMFFLRMTEILFHRAPIFLLGTFGGITLLGLFERSQFLVFLPNRLLQNFHSTVAFPVYSKVQHDKSKLSEGATFLLWFVVRLVVPAFLCVLFFPGPILVLVLGAQWSSAAFVLQGFSFFLLCMPIHGALKSLLFSQGAVRVVTITSIISLLLIIVWAGYTYFFDGNWSFISWALSVSMVVATTSLAGVCNLQGITIGWMGVLRFPVTVTGFFVTVLWLYRDGLSAHPYLFMIIIVFVWFSLTLVFEKKHYVRLRNYMAR